MCETAASAPTSVRSVMLPALKVMAVPNMMGCYAELEKVGTPPRLLSELLRWVCVNCLQCEICSAVMAD